MKGMENGNGNGNGAVRVESKSAVVAKLNAEWGRYILYHPERGLIVPEHVLESYGLLLTHGNKIFTIEAVKPFFRYLVVWNEGTNRKPVYTAAVAAEDGATVIPKSKDMYANYEKYMNLWYHALRVHPREPQVSFSASVRESKNEWVVETPVLTVIGKRVEYYDRRYALYEVFTRLSGAEDIVQKLYAVARKRGFSQGQYRGYIRRGPISDDELRVLKEETLALIESEKGAIAERWLAAVKARLDADRQETENARRALGIQKPAEEPITREDILSLFGIREEKKGEAVAPKPEPAEETEPVLGGELEVAPAPAPPAILPEPQAAAQVKVEEAVAPAPAVTAPKAGELVKLYLLVFTLPSRYAAARTKYLIEEEEGRHVLVERRVFEELATVIETARREAYEELKRAFAAVPELGVWIAVTDAAVEEAKRVADFVAKKIIEGAEKKKLDAEAAKRVAARVRAEAWPVYLEPKNARELLEKAVAKLSEDVAELRERINEAEKESLKKTLGAKLAQVDKLLSEFREKLKTLDR